MHNTDILSGPANPPTYQLLPPRGFWVGIFSKPVTHRSYDGDITGLVFPDAAHIASLV